MQEPNLPTTPESPADSGTDPLKKATATDYFSLYFVALLFTVFFVFYFKRPITHPYHVVGVLGAGLALFTVPALFMHFKSVRAGGIALFVCALFAYFGYGFALRNQSEEAFRTQFLNTCVQVDPSLLAYCECTLDALLANHTVQELTQAMQGQNGQAPSREFIKTIEQARQTCLVSEGLAQNNEPSVQATAEAQYFYAQSIAYSNGMGVPKDETKALDFLIKAAELDHPQAQLELGNLYAEGALVPQNLETAFTWYKQAHDNGILMGTCQVGFAHYFGSGAPKDEALGLQYINQACEEGEEQCCELRQKYIQPRQP